MVKRGRQLVLRWHINFMEQKTTRISVKNNDLKELMMMLHIIVSYAVDKLFILYKLFIIAIVVLNAQKSKRGSLETFCS